MPKTWVFQSDSNPNTTFTTTQRDDGTRTCTCHGAKPLANGSISCKHTRLIDQGLADQQAISVSDKPNGMEVLKLVSKILKGGVDVGGWTASMPDFADIEKMIKLPEESEDSGETPTFGEFLPQLLTPIEMGEVSKYIESDKWGAQEKIDGKRVMLRVYQTNGGDFQALAFNRKGKTCDCPDDILQTAATLGKEGVIDGELIESEGRFYAFDFIEDTSDHYHKRYQALSSLLLKLNKFQKDSFRLVHLVYGTTEKKKLFESLKGKGREGIVFKKLSAKYTAGRGPDQLKCKFYATVTCMVTNHSTQMSKHTGSAKSSISLGLYKTQKQKKVTGGILAEVGNCTIPSGWELPVVGTFVEIRYLYAYKGGSLYQPVFLGVRDDVGADCLDDLKYKSEEGGSLAVQAEKPIKAKQPAETPVIGNFRRVLWKD